MVCRSVSCLIILCLAQCVTACLGPPYLYVTYHGGHHSSDFNNVVKYSRDGCAISTSVLNGGGPEELRRMKFARAHQQSGNLFVVSAYKDNSGVLLYGDCDGSGTRNYQETVISPSQSGGIDHPYGIAISPMGNIYVSNQDTNAVIRFYGNGSYKPMPSPPGVSNPQYDGVFLQLDPSSDGIRSLTFVGDNLFVCSEDDNAVLVVDPSGSVISKVALDSPVGVWYDQTTNLVFAGGHGDTPGVIAFDPSTLSVQHTYTAQNLTHPTGLATNDGQLIVLGQNSGGVFFFDIATTNLSFSFVANAIDDQLEDMQLSNC